MFNELVAESCHPFLLDEGEKSSRRKDIELLLF